MKWTTVFLALLALQACATTDPGAGAGIAYFLPRTDVKVTLGLDVKACEPQLLVEPTLSLEAIAGAQDKVFRIEGRELISALARRSTTIDVDKNGVITDIDAATTDQQAAVVGGVVKLVAAVAGSGFGYVGPEPPMLSCSPETERSLLRTVQLAAAIEARRAGLSAASEPSGVQKEIDALAVALASARATLHASVSAKIALDGDPPSAGASLALRDPDFGDFGGFRQLLLPKVRGRLESELEHQFGLEASLQTLELAAVGEPKSPPTCRVSVLVPAARRVRVVVAARNTTYQRNKPATLDVFASQFAPPAEVCLTTAFGESRTVGLAFDPFGRTTKLTVSADARVANIVGAAATAAPDAAKAMDDARGAGLAHVRDEASQVTADNALRIARACQAALEAGAAVCPTR